MARSRHRAAGGAAASQRAAADDGSRGVSEERDDGTRTPPRAREAYSPNATPLRMARAKSPSSDDEVEQLHARIAELVEEKKHNEQILSALAEQNWQFLIDRAERLKAKFDREMQSLISDVQALCEFSQQQKAAAFTPSRSRAASISGAAVANDPSNGGALTPPRAAPSADAKFKEFSWRDSQLTTMFRTSSDIKTVYNMFVAVLILFAMKVFINDFFNATLTPESFRASIQIFLWNFSKVTLVIPFWIVLFLTHSLILPVMWAWRQNLIGDAGYTAAYLFLQTFFLFGYGWAISALDLPVASSLILLCEQVRMLMKCHSFWRETLRIRHNPSETPRGINTHTAHSSSKVNSTLLPTFRDQLNQFVLFHFVPTLIYRNSYPRTRHIRWSFVGKCCVEVLGCIFYIYVIFANFCIPEYQKTSASPGDLQQLFVSLFNSVLPGIAVYLLAFFGLLHCWMNMFAELTRFADRLFYSDWWNVTSFSSYYRKWNMIVHDSLYNYIYVDLRKLGCPQGLCFFTTFLVSAIVHEYIISLTLKFFYPVLLVMFLGFGVFFVYLTKYLGTQGRSWNIFFWANLIIGNGMLLIMYSREYYARQPEELRTGVQGPKFDFDQSSWLPWSWQPFLRA